MLAILTLGVVSASDDVNNLTAVDDAVVTSADDVAETVSQIEEVDSVAGDNSGDEVLSGEQEVDYNSILPDEIRMGDSWSDENDRTTYVGVRFNEEEISGDVEFYVDDVLKSTQPAESSYYGDYRGVHFDLLENNIGAGLHNITIKYLGDDNYAPFEINHKVELYYMKSAVPEIVKEDFTDQSFRILFALDATGYLDLFLDDTLVKTFDVYNDRYVEEENWYTPWLLINPSEYVDFGVHTYSAKYYGGNYENKTVNGSFKLDYAFEVDCGDYYYGEPLEFRISLPDGATNNITLSVNGKTYNIENVGEDDIYYWGEIYYTLEEVPYGENQYVFSYEDNKFPKKDVILELNVKGVIKGDYGKIPYGSDDKNITLILPDDADGNLTVYKLAYNPDSEDYDEIEIATSKLVNGKASISFSNLELGQYNIRARYVGEDYEAQPFDSYFELVPNVEYPKGIWTESTDDHKITVTSPSDVDANLTIDIYTSTLDEEDYDPQLVKQIYSGDAKGTVSETIPALEVGVYSIKVSYIKDESTLSESYKLVVSDANPDWTMKVDVPKEVVKGDEEYEDYNFWPENLPSKEGQVWLSLYIDGKYYIGRYYDDDGEFECSISKLNIGTHTWKVTYHGSSYYSDASAEGTFEVVWIAIPEVVIDGKTTVACYLDNDATGYISLSIDGKDYAMEFVEDGYASFKLSNLTLGEHTYEFIYSGDANHEKLTKTGSFNSTMYFEMNDWLDYDDMSAYMESYPVSFELPSDATGTITLTVGDKTYTEEVVNGAASFEITDLGLGQYELVARYSGDDKYPEKEISKKFEIIGYEIDVDYSDEDELENFISVSITLPSDATGSLVLYKENGYDEETGEQLWEEFKRVGLENGKAKILASDLILPFGSYDFRVVYEGDESYVVEYKDVYLSLKPTINVTESVNLGENATINIDLGDATGNIDIYINGDEFKTVELENGKVNVDVPADKLTKEENIVTFKYDGEELDYNPFGYYDEDDEFVPNEYPIRVELKELEIPDDFASDGTGNITLELPEGSRGNVTVYVDDEKVSTTPVTGGTNTIPVSELPTGDHNVRVEYEDENGNKYSTSKNVNVPKPEPKMDIVTPTDSTNPEFSINLPEDATGSLIVTVDGKNYAADLVNGKATVSVPDLANGNHNVTIKYTGDKNYSGFVKDTTVVVNMTPKKEDVTPEPEKKADKITLKLAKVKKVKRSAKKLVIKATLKINGKAAKGKKLKFKFNKKTYKAKTNKKGVAKITIKKKVLKKLKVGKKVKIQVSYGKKTAKIKVKVKK